MLRTPGWVYVVSFLGIGVCLSFGQRLHGETPHPTPPSHISAKCSFLKSEVYRLSESQREVDDNSPLSKVNSAADLAAVGSSVSEFAVYFGATETSTAKKSLLRMEAAACLQNIALSDPHRIAEIDRARAAHIQKLARKWKKVAGDEGTDLESQIESQVNAIYEADTKSFYNREKDNFDDPDIGKDYPDLPALIANSGLDFDTKQFYQQNARFLRYQEAGQLVNILKGIAKDGSLNYAYLVRQAVSKRAADFAARQQAAAQQLLQQQEQERNKAMTEYTIVSIIILLVIAGLWAFLSRSRAKYRAFRTGAKRSPFWFGNAEWIFWEPGETVVLLEHKRLVPMMDPGGGYCVISAWRGQEFKGRISYKTRVSTWTSEQIHTSDGLPVHLAVGIWWRIADARVYVSAIASDYHEETESHREDLSDAAEFWIRKLAAGTLREEINQLPGEKLISPYVQAYLKVRRGPDGELLPDGDPIKSFSEQLAVAQRKLHEKTIRYGIEVERLEVQELILPKIYQDKLEAVRVAFLQPVETSALSRAQVIALEGLASVIGKDKVGLIEVLKHVKLSHKEVSPFGGGSVLSAIVNALERETQRAIAAGSSSSPGLPSAGPEERK